VLFILAVQYENRYFARISWSGFCKGGFETRFYDEIIFIIRGAPAQAGQEGLVRK
jgi:hypothetical protein